MSSHDEPEPEFFDLLDALTVPEPEPSATIRVAEVHFGGKVLAPAIRAAGMEVVATLDARSELPDFDTMKPFNLVIADVPTDSDEWDKATSYMMRFIRVRRPVAFVILDHTEEELRRVMLSKSQPYGYDVSSTNRDELDFIAGVLDRAPEGATWESLHAAVKRIRDETEAGS